MELYKNPQNSNNRNHSSFLHVLSSKIFKFHVEIGEWNFWESRGGLFSKFAKIEISKNFKTQNPMTKCLFLMCFFQLSFLNFGIESFQDFFRMSIPKFKMHFLGVWRKKIFHEFGVGFMFWAMKFFILGLGEIFEEFWIGFGSESIQQPIQDFELNWFKKWIKINLEFLIRIDLSHLSRSFDNNLDKNQSKTLNWTDSKNE